MNGMTVILRKELRDAVQGRWLLVFAGVFGLLALTLSLVDRDAGTTSAQSFNRTTAGLINLCLLIVPLLALVLGAGAIAGERERGTLAGLLANPVTTTEVLLGKYFGLVISVWMAIALGFGAAALLVSPINPLTGAGHYLLFAALSAGLATAMVSIGVLISVLSNGRTKAMAIAVAVWFGLVLFYNLGAIGLALAVSSSGQTLLVAVLGNPVESVRILAVLSLEPDLAILGPLGSYLSNEFGQGRSAMLLGGNLVAWAAAPLALAIYIFRRQDA